MNEAIETLDVCICTFRRPSVLQTLDSIAAQRLPPDLALSVIVVDNDDTDVARPAIVDRARSLDLTVRYVHAPRRNISIARNACLGAARNDWIAFIDDDEVATPDWVASLFARRADTHMVFGVSAAQYVHPGTPKWIVAGDFHSNRIAGNDPSWNGYTANVLIDRRFVVANGLRFATELGQVGGEDTMFFFDAHRAGARFGYAPDAVVTEETPIARANFRWLALRRFRAGQIHYMTVSRDGRAGRAAALAVPKAALSFVRAAMACPWPERAAAHALRGMLHLGVVASCLGFAPYREYRS